MAVAKIVVVLIACVGASQLNIGAMTADVVPDVVIFGIGDSGTRGVKEMMQHLGVTMCSHANGQGDNMATRAAHAYIPELLRAAGGHVSETKGYMSSDVFDEAVQALLAGAKKTWTCAVKEKGLKKDSLPADFRWGYKNPRQMYLLPVMDMAFHGKQKMLAVARDPRDLCTAHNKQQMNAYGSDVNLPDDLRELHRFMNITMLEERIKPHEKCLTFWSAAWTSILQEYAHNENFLVVRIEDLVIPDPTTSKKAHDTLKRMMEHVRLSPSTDRMRKQLEIAHSHKDSYMGHHYNMTEEYRKKLEHEVASYTGPVHAVMQALGYRVEEYGLVTPKHHRVISL